MPQAERNRFSDEFSGLAEMLHDGGLILHPTDTLWSVSAALHQGKRLLDLPLDNNSIGERLVVIVRDVAMMKQYIVDLHPRVETLLFYHMRPLIVLGSPPRFFPEWMTNGQRKLAVMICRDAFCQQLLKALKGPLVSTPAYKDMADGIHGFGRISSDIIECIDYIHFHAMESDQLMEDCPVIRYDQNGNIFFEKE